MAELEEQLRGELSAVLDQIRGAGGGVMFEEFPGAIEDLGGSDPAEDDRSAARRALIEQANDLAETLERIRHGPGGMRG
jgi:hypothetical protein